MSVGTQELVLLPDADGLPLREWADAIQRCVDWLYLQPVAGEIRLSHDTRDGPPSAIESGRSEALRERASSM